MKTKILFTAYTDYPSPDTGGPNKIIYQILKHLDYDKFTARYISKHLDTLFNSKDDFERLNDSIPVQKKVSTGLYKSFPGYRKFVNSSTYLAYHYKKNNQYFAHKNILDFRPDVIHSHDPRSHYYFSTYPCKKILTIHSKGMVVNDMMNSIKATPILQKHFAFFKKTELAAFNESDIVTFPSKFAGDLYLSESGLNPEKVKTIYNGVETGLKFNDESLNDVLAAKEGYDYTICNVAEHIKVKNIDKILNAVSILKNKYSKKVKFLNIGRGVETDNLKKLVKSLNLENEVTFVDFLPNKRLLEVISTYQYYISASEKVIFDMIILEAMAAGLSVIASADGGNLEIIKDNYNGFLIQENTPEAIVNVLLNADRNKVKENSSNSIKEFSVERMIENYISLYTK